MKPAVAGLLFCLASSCYLSHPGEPGSVPRPRDSGTDTLPPPVDTTPPPECADDPWVRIDLGTFDGTRIGPVAASPTTIAWVGTNRLDTSLTRLDRDTLTLTVWPVDFEYMQDAAVYWTGEVFIVAYEHTAAMGMNQGVFVTIAEDGIDGPVRPPIQLSPTGGDPSITGGRDPDRVLIAWYDRGAVITELSIRRGEPTRMNVRLDDDDRLSVAVTTTPTDYLLSHSRRIVRIDPVTFTASELVTTTPSSFVRKMVANDLGFAVEYFGGAVESFFFDGSSVATERPDGDDIMIAGYRSWFFGINRRTGASGIVNSTFDVEFDPGDFVPDLASVNRTPTGFVALSASLPVGNDPLVSLIERCVRP